MTSHAFHFIILPEHLLCRNCGHEVAKASDLISVPSHHAIYQRNETIMGVEDVLIQYFRNPAGMHFELITTSSAVVDTSSKAYPADTWFDNFTWKMVKCRRCYVHLGWCYEPGENLKAKCRDCEDTNRAITERLRFYGLILDKIIHQEYADSLVMSPKFYGG
ncbi:hypothetical protein HOLleu_24529 [Holothuria leucospilota]|uniref:CULT domain-containing protein n=1 Tax=Holothuria leucospilota TaxID=206669 RepID=A0A9Q1BWU6_HOLLE|nr:hypothetical protein HOLleu_24529 [Holothuria leucospilota]